MHMELILVFLFGVVVGAAGAGYITVKRKANSEFALKMKEEADRLKDQFNSL